MKCGTTSLFYTLAKHPEVAASTIKEPGFFKSDDAFAKGSAWYLDLFGWNHDRHTIAVEASGAYSMCMAYQDVPLRMRSTGWTFRFVYLVRDPLERIRSHYLHNAAKNMGLPPLAKGLNDFTIDFSRYHKQLGFYRDAFDRESILVLSQDDLKTDPNGAVDQVCDHLGIARNGDVTLKTLHMSEYHYHRALLIQELRKRNSVAEGITLDNIHEILSALSADEQEAIEARAKAHYTLSEADCERVRRELADEMRLLHADYGIDVTRWGFKA